MDYYKPTPRFPDYKDTLYLAVRCEAQTYICDCCDLQGECTWEFGDRGKNCPIVDKHYVWLRMDDIMNFLKPN